MSNQTGRPSNPHQPIITHGPATAGVPRGASFTISAMQVVTATGKIMKLIFVFTCVLSLLSAGCVTQSPPRESDALDDVAQLTHGFARAGEAYFAPDSRWIVFQATPRGE